MWGRLPDWGRADLPEPLPFSPANCLRTIGPGAILLAAAIGGGEWLVGPAVAVQHGRGLMWIATIGIVLQVLFNLEALRYTLYTGEPILTGIMRLRPGSRVWGTFYTLLAFAQLGVPAVGATCAAVLFAAWMRELPTDADATTLHAITWGVILVSVALLFFGGTIEKTLERLSWAMIVLIFAFLLVVNVAFVSAADWSRTLTGFVSFGAFPGQPDLLLVAALASTAASGGVGNLAVTNWARDKGLGMGGRVGAIPSAFGSRTIQLSHTGKVFPLTPENLRRWNLWWRYVRIDQIWLWGLGCFLGMFLNVNLATALIPAGENISGVAAGTHQAQYLAEHVWTGFWHLALLNGFWILFSTQLGNTDVLIRTLTDILWTGSERLRRLPGTSIRGVYYGLLVVLTVWGLVSITWAYAMTLFQILAFVAGLILAIAALHILLVNTRLLPPELRPPLWRRAALVACSLFYFVTTGAVVWDKLFG